VLDPGLPEAGDLAQQAVDAGPEAILARLDETIALQRERATRGGLFPRLDLLGTAGIRDSHTEWAGGTETDLATRTATAGLNLSWDLYTGGQSGVNRQRARIATQQATLRLEQTLWQAGEEARLALDRFKTLDRQRDLALEGVAVARQQLELVSRQYALGAASSLDFRDAQLSVAGAEQNLAILDKEWILARLEIERRRGRLLETVLGEH
jgi:outer membrane protein TolC